MSGERGILGVRKDPKNQLLFMFKVREGEEWPSSDSGDSDYSPEQDSRTVADHSDDSEDESTTKSSPKQSSRRQNSNNSARPTRKPSRKRTLKQKDSKTKTKRQKRSNTNHTASSSKTSSQRQEASETRHLNGESSVIVLSNATVPHLPPELWLKIFKYYVDAEGPLPFLCRAAKGCRCWAELAAHPSLWQKVDLSYGWLKSTDDTLKWLAHNRLSQCREVSVSGWKNLTNDAFKVLCEKCPQLEVVNLSHCGKLTSIAVSALVSNRLKLRELDLSFMPADAVSAQSLKQVATKCGAALTSLVLAGNSLVGFNLVLNAIMDNCPNLETLDLCNCRFSTDFLILNVERLQASCPSLRILRLANCKVRPNQVSQNVQAQATGFVNLHQLSCAMPVSDSPTIGNGVPDNLLARLLHKAERIQLLDLRGCTNFNPDTLLAAPALNVEQLYLSQSSVSRYSATLRPLLMMWRHSLKVLDMHTHTQPPHC
ncbi:F-box/LRR-repeat protein 6-like isoform X2 [Littorina saxatilis]|uniref:F-box/LRR-repeat protein 6-like isoform X2 n=1 Tax=Littorina saxatilis TaxID=31220 RepID=UPI0038B4676B